MLLHFKSNRDNSDFFTKEYHKDKETRNHLYKECGIGTISIEGKKWSGIEGGEKA